MPTWTVHLEGGPRRVNHAAIAVGEKVFSFGGYCTGDDYENTRPIDVHVLNTESFRWCKLPLPDDYHYDENSNIPYQRYGHTAVSYKDCAYIWGGRNDKDGACAALFCFDTETHEWSRVPVVGDVPGARDGHSACVVGDKMYIFGGYEEEIDRFSNDVHYLDFTTWTWSGMLHVQKGKPAMWRDFHTSSAIGHQIYVFGGRSDVGGNQFTNREIYENIVYTFNTLTNAWDVVPTRGRKPIGRRSHSTFELGGCLYVFGGYNGLLDQHFADLYRYDPETREWSIVLANGEGPCPRRRQCCCVIGSRVFLFGGTSPSGKKETGPTSEQDLVDHSDLHVLDFSPSLKTLCLLATLQHKLDTSCLPQNLRWELKAMTTNNTITRSLNNTSG